MRKRKGMRERDGMSINKERVVWMRGVVVHSLQKESRQCKRRESKVGEEVKKRK